jgi:hypothetical protein
MASAADNNGPLRSSPRCAGPCSVFSSSYFSSHPLHRSPPCRWAPPFRPLRGCCFCGSRARAWGSRTPDMHKRQSCNELPALEVPLFWVLCCPHGLTTFFFRSKARTAFSGHLCTAPARCQRFPRWWREAPWGSLIGLMARGRMRSLMPLLDSSVATALWTKMCTWPIRETAPSA